MSDSATVYMVQLDESMFVPLRNAILAVCRKYVEEYEQRGVRTSYVQHMAFTIGKAAKLSDLHDAGEGTLVCVNGIWFTRSSRYALERADDEQADIINEALHSINATMVYVTEICY